MKLSVLVVLMSAMFISAPSMGLCADMGTYTYKDFKKAKACKVCHKDIYQEWQQSLMAQSFTHGWSDVEYFKLALPHAMQLDKVAEVKAGCIGCHSPLAFLSGDIPPKPPAEKTRANEGVSCEVCHIIRGSSEPVPFNFSYEVEPGKVKVGPRKDIKSPFHQGMYSEFIRSPEFCANCHDEQSPYGAWVKSTYREWKAGPYAKEGHRCQDCHMYYAPGKSAVGGKVRDDVAHHVFHGAHFPNKLRGAVDVAMYPKKDTVRPGGTLKLRVELYNGKAGHYVPTGSTEERMLWLEVRAIASDGTSWVLPVNPKGFAGEEYTISDSTALAYQAMDEIMGVANATGISRDGDVPDGARIFRRPFFDPKGRMTICQWFTAENTMVDYRIGPRETKIETYTWAAPNDLPSGPVTIKADLLYALVPSSVGTHLDLSEKEYEPVLVNTSTVTLNR